MDVPEVIKKLNSKDSSAIYEGLIDIRKNYVRNFKKMRLLEKYSVIPLLVSFFQQPKFTSISLSIIADACMQNYWVEKVVQSKGVESLVHVMKNLANREILNRACRALGNIAKCDKRLYKNSNFSDLVTGIIEFLSGATETTYKQTAVRTLRILGSNPKSCDLIIRENGIVCLLKLLSSTDKDLVLSSIQAIADLTEGYNSDYVPQVIDGDTLNILIISYSDTKLTDNVKLSVIKLLKNLSCHEKARSSLTKSGAVKLLFQVAVDLDASLEMKRLSLLGFYNCVTYKHMSSSCGICHERVFKPLLNASIVSILINNLLLFVKRNEIDHVKSERCVEFLSSAVEYNPSEGKQEPNLQFNVYDNKGKIKACDASISLKLPSDIESAATYSARSPTSDYLSCSPGHSKKSPSYSGSDSAFSPLYYSESSFSPPSSHEANVWRYSPVEKASCDKNMLVGDTSNAASVSKTSPKEFISSDENLQLNVETVSTSFPVEVVSSVDTSGAASESRASPKEVISDCENVQLSEKPVSTSFLLQPNKLEDTSGLYYEKYCSSDSEQSLSDQETLNYPCSKRRKKDTLEPIESNIERKDEGTSTEVREQDNLAINTFDQVCSSMNTNYTLDHLILQLLSSLSYHMRQKNNPVLASKSYYSVLMTYAICMKNPSPNAEKMLLSLVKNRHFFDRLIQNGFFTDVEEMFVIYHKVEECKFCQNIYSIYKNIFSAIRNEAQSDFGIGSLCHILRTSGTVAKSHVMLAVSKLISDKRALYKLLIQANGLNILFQFLSDLKTMSIKDVKCLCQLFQNIKKDKREKNVHGMLKYNNRCVYESEKCDVKFIVDGDIYVGAVRDKLCINSDYFNALLKGYFLEQSETTVKISGISAEALKIIFHFLHGCCNKGYCYYLKAIEFETLMELFSESDKYLLHEIKLFAESRLYDHISPETVVKLYQFAKIHNATALYNKVLEYILDMNVSLPPISNAYLVVLECFKRFVELSVEVDVFADLERLVKSLLL